MNDPKKVGHTASAAALANGGGELDSKEQGTVRMLIISWNVQWSYVVV